jgi:hypothetical protein
MYVVQAVVSLDVSYYYFAVSSCRRQNLRKGFFKSKEVKATSPMKVPKGRIMKTHGEGRGSPLNLWPLVRLSL